MRYHNITKDDMLNGDGLRVVLWVAGCAHACPGCHNPITWDEQGGIEFDDAAKDEIFAELEKDYIHGLTLSGGDPLHPVHREEIAALAAEVRERFPAKSIWMYTGYQWDEIRHLDAVSSVDVLVDGRFEIENANPQLWWKGSSNQNVIDVPKTLECGTMVLKTTA